MIEFVFTIDYEIYGNGEGSLRELIIEPAERLKNLFEKWNARFVVFVEAAELDAIDTAGTDASINSVKKQIQEFHRDGFEIGLHIHPQWCNASFGNGRWRMDYDEYNLCRLPGERIAEIVDHSLAFLRKVLGQDDFLPTSYRAGNWLLQPTSIMTRTLAGRGIRIDSSVYKGGLQYQHCLDYRRSLKNGYFWRFGEDVNVPNPYGPLMEIPIFSKMVPTFRMFSAKRIGLLSKAPSTLSPRSSRLGRLRDFARLYHPLKLDFCRLTIKELMPLLNAEIKKDKRKPSVYRPLVAIGHTKDLTDFKTIESLLSILAENELKITLFKAAYEKATFHLDATRREIL
jgi:hypothetical protein